jgi:hypothetical protein
MQPTSTNITVEQGAVPNAWVTMQRVGLAIVLMISVGCAPDVTSPKSTINKAPAAGQAQPGPVNGWSPGEVAQRPLDRDKPTHVLIEVDGGGIMGIAPALVLADLEKRLQHSRHIAKLADAVSVFSGTSTGAIISGMLAAGLTAQDVAHYYETEGVTLFNSSGCNRFPVFPFFRAKFKRDVFQDSLFEALKKHHKDQFMTLGDMYSGPLLLIASYDLCSERTLWFRTRDLNDQPLRENANVELVDAISTSAFSAAIYFGKLHAPGVVWDQWQSDGSTRQMRGAVFNDGGQGTQNSTLAQVTLQSIIQGWGNRSSSNDQVVIISLGCGNNFSTRDYAEASGLSPVGQTVAFLENEARPESLILQWRAATFISAHNPNFRVYRFDYVPPAHSSAFSAKLVDKYEKAAAAMTMRPDYQRLVNDLGYVNVAPIGPKPRANPPATEKQNSALNGI